MKITKTDEAFLRGLRGSKHWREADARRALSLCKASGQSRGAFARRDELRASRFAWWERRLGVRGSERPEHASTGTPTRRGPRFVELVVGSDAEPTCAAATVRVGSVVVELATLDAAAADFVAALFRSTGSGACS